MADKRRGNFQGNRILAALPASEFKLFSAASEKIELGPGDAVGRVGELVQHVYFPSQGVLQLIARVTGGADVGVGFVGTDGMWGLDPTVGRDTSNLGAFSQNSGHGDRVELRAFRHLLMRCPDLKQSLFTYAVRTAAQMSQNSACVALHTSRRRIARWMLDVSEGSSPAVFTSTQAAIAAALGLQRPAVSAVAASLQSEGVIRYMRGEVTILNRRALRSAACRCSLTT